MANVEANTVETDVDALASGVLRVVDEPDPASALVAEISESVADPNGSFLIAHHTRGVTLRCQAGLQEATRGRSLRLRSR